VITGGGGLTANETSAPVIIVAMGPSGGSGQLPGSDELAAPEFVAQIKGHDMLLGRFTELFGRTSPANA
jgi:hypothetical protein